MRHPSAERREAAAATWTKTMCPRGPEVATCFRSSERKCCLLLLIISIDMQTEGMGSLDFSLREKREGKGARPDRCDLDAEIG